MSSPVPSRAGDRATPRTRGPGRLLLAVYAVFVVGSLSRAAFQIATKWEQAPLAYALSALAGAVYVVATVALAVPGRRAWWVCLGAIGVELVGVLAVGTWSLLQPQLFPDATVWSQYGRGYLFVPLVLPVAGLWWLWRTRPGITSTGSRPPR